MFYLYTCFCHEFFFVLVKSEFEELSEVSKFRVNSLSIVCHCAKHNLPTLIYAARRTRFHWQIYVFLCGDWSRTRRYRTSESPIHPADYDIHGVAAVV